ncbi:group III truncated hemoglobin [Amylibacter sp. IMCC11727]|uniref:group III truncated hemoglobin n=1 Tax=Amylibacter sp. IMCC11727 TaxID=3039851 RepID=UPI00244E2607|nr:group III truncated hemoglobin [Amylibacter sp. IMCC11727]WGI22586.1 group III truncated hemoglobin [Amylibacter sp. IMCC11727]
MTAQPPRIAVTRPQIEQVVHQFYANVRVDPVLGPLFNDILSKDPAIWHAHEAKITDFWSNALLYERGYDGNPMLVHSGISALEPRMFTDWLNLFDATLSAILSPEIAVQWSALAHRIGRSLRMGVEMQSHRTGAPPNLV